MGGAGPASAGLCAATYLMLDPSYCLTLGLGIPNYRLEDCVRTVDDLKHAPSLTLWTGLKAISCCGTKSTAGW